MKRFFIMLVAVFLAASPFASAETTQRVDAFVFQMLFAKRYTKYLIDNDLDYDFYIDPFIAPMYIEDEIFVSTSVATLILDAKDFTIKKATMTMIDMSASDEANLANICESLVAMSALECSDMEERMMELMAKVRPEEPANAIEMMLNLWNNGLYEKVGDAFGKATDKDVLVYSGNYDYYVSYYFASAEDGDHEFYSLEARTK